MNKQNFSLYNDLITLIDLLVSFKCKWVLDKRDARLVETWINSLINLKEMMLAGTYGENNLIASQIKVIYLKYPELSAKYTKRRKRAEVVAKTPALQPRYFLLFAFVFAAVFVLSGCDDSNDTIYNESQLLRFKCEISDETMTLKESVSYGRGIIGKQDKTYYIYDCTNGRHLSDIKIEKRS